jgi:hypothetical protein
MLSHNQRWTSKFAADGCTYTLVYVEKATFQIYGILYRTSLPLRRACLGYTKEQQT